MSPGQVTTVEQSRPMRPRRPIRIDAPLPPRGPARWATIAALVIGGMVAILVPIVFAVMVWGYWVG